SGTTNANGSVTIDVPGGLTYDVKITDYTERKLINVPNAPGGTMTSHLYYSRTMVADDAAFQMNAAEMTAVDNYANALPDTTWFDVSHHPSLNNQYNYQRITLTLSDLNDGPLSGETVTLIGRKRGKAFKGTTDADGSVILYLPKGDEYDLSFYYHRNFEYTECKYSKGTSEVDWEFQYVGTVAYAKMMKEEAARQEAERIADSIAKANPQSLASGPNLVAPAFEKNNWKSPLIICDVSSSMDMIMGDLEDWFRKNASKYPDAQFVFFNDGDGKASDLKKSGETGGIYYTPSLPIDKLIVFMNDIHTRGEDDDEPDNYMEALIKGVQLAKKPFSDIVLIVDNHATVSDMDLLPQFDKPVHIIVTCSIKAGCIYGFVQPDYLKIAWKTKGTVHVNNQDYNEIGNMKNGDEIAIGSGKFKLVNGIFIEEE
ncbi:MAG TPA: hypothetical protein VL651_05730, partial [Bacteroidia bacterium]|nr:hypothetical protein [Bacteroidia bacterium]